MEYRVRRPKGFTHYYVCWSERGRSKRWSTGSTDYASAREVGRQWWSQRNQPAGPAPTTVASILDAYLSHREGRVVAHQRLREACQPLRKHLGHMVATELSPAVCDDYRAERNVSPWTARKELTTLSAALLLAKRKQVIAEVPLLDLGKVPPPRDRWLTPEEAEQLVAASQDHCRTFVVLGLHTGARKQAILGLTWDRVDFDSGLISYVDPDRPETKKRRATVPMNDTVRAELVRARELAQTPYVIEYAGRPVASIKRSFTKAVNRAGLEDVSPHILRHTCATWMAMAGVQLDQIADYLAAEPRTVWSTYRKHQPGYLQSAADALRTFAHPTGNAKGIQGISDAPEGTLRP